MRTFCRTALILFVFCAPGVALCQQTDSLKPGWAAPVLKYQAVPEWPRPALGDKGFPAGPWNYWQVPGVTVEQSGNILVLHRGDDPILEYKPNGDLIGPWGDVKFSQGKVTSVPKEDRTAAMSGYQAIYGPSGCSNCGAHEIRTDPAGNIWVVDAPAQVIYKLNPQGHTLMTLGTKGKAGMSAAAFYLPTDVAFAPNGDIVVSDGYGNARIVRFSADGKFLSQFGQRGNGPGQFQLPHNVVIDATGRIYVADRDNQRVEVFDSNGKYLSEWDHIGGVSSLVMTKDQHVWTGGVLRDLSGSVIGRLPGEGSTESHGAAVAANGDVYLGLLAGKVEKFVKQ
jgi:DNA-binding beta-propeller fold protein YncE